MLNTIKSTTKFMPKSLGFITKIPKIEIQRSKLRSVRSRVIDLIPLNQTILVELSSEIEN